MCHHFDESFVTGCTEIQICHIYDSRMKTLWHGNVICRSPVNSPQRASDIGLWYFLWCWPEQKGEERVELPVIWYPVILIGRYLLGPCGSVVCSGELFHLYARILHRWFLGTIANKSNTRDLKLGLLWNFHVKIHVSQKRFILASDWLTEQPPANQKPW